MSRASPELACLHNGEALPLDRVPLLGTEDFGEAIVAAVAEAGVEASADAPDGAPVRGGEGRMRVASLFAMAGEGPGRVELVALLADDLAGEILAARTEITGGAFPSLTPRCPQVHLFEREIAEQFSLRAEGHPWMKPVRFAATLGGRPGTPDGLRTPTGPGGGPPQIGVTDFYRVDGEEVHEVAVGPVHAGVIEPGHFRFQCHGERVFHLEISLGYQHRGIEEGLLGGPHRLTPHQMETAAGDSSVAHAWAYCQNLEALAVSRRPLPAQAQVVRSIALELERLANHTGDLGALAGDVGYLPTMSYCGRIRGDFLNLTALLCGNRFGRGLLRPGGTGFSLDRARVEEIARRLEAARKDVTVAVELLWASPSVMARFENTGTVDRELALRLGLVGPAARACGLERDVRSDHPTGVYQFSYLPAATVPGGDVNARAFVRWLEIQRSIDFIRGTLRSLPADGARPGPIGPLAPRQIAVSLIEGWRGEVCHAAVTDAGGRFARYKITDPSFHNWMGLAMALRDQQISDFPLCNKSFNLSYCGHDL